MKSGEKGRINLVKVSMAISICPFVVFIMSAFIVKIIPMSSVFSEILSSLNDYPITNMSYNPDWKDQYVGTIYHFPGNQEGCSCIHEKDEKYKEYSELGLNRINIGLCTSWSFQKTNGCFDINSVNKINLISWGQGKFCSKKYNTSEFELKGYLLYLSHSVLEKEECEKGYKKCGKLDDVGNYLCIEENEECPINDIKITNSRDEEYEKLNYSHIIINDNKYLYYTNTSEKPVISKLKVVEDGILCIDKTQFFTKFPQYILDQNYNNYGCRFINGNFYENDTEILDYRTKEILYNDSDINLTKTFPDYTYGYPFSSLKANMTLYPHRYIGFDKKCFLENGVFDINNTPFTEDKINNINKLLSDIIYINDFTKWFSASSIIIELLACVVCNIMVDNFKWRIWIWTVINCLLYISMAVPICINMNKVMQLFLFPCCGNDIINTRINFYHTTKRTLEITTIISLVFLNLQIVFNIVIIIIRYMIEKKEAGEHSYNQPLVFKSYSIENQSSIGNKIIDNQNDDENDENNEWIIYMI